jgi:hypothetical protein
MEITIDSFFPDLTLTTIDGLTKYYDTIESQLQSAKQEEHQRVLAEIRNLELDWEDEFAEWDIAMQEHTATHNMLFSNFFRYSFIVLLFLVLENQLRELCSIVGKLKENAPPRAEREIIKTYKNYLKRSGIDIPDQLWESIHNVNKVRNCIVHTSGSVKGFKYEQHLRRIAQQGVGLDISGYNYQGGSTPLYLEDDMLILEPEYCKRTIADIRKLFEELCDAIPLHGIVIKQNS